MGRGRNHRHSAAEPLGELNQKLNLVTDSKMGTTSSLVSKIMERIELADCFPICNIAEQVKLATGETRNIRECFLPYEKEYNQYLNVYDSVDNIFARTIETQLKAYYRNHTESKYRKLCRLDIMLIQLTITNGFCRHLIGNNEEGSIPAGTPLGNKFQQFIDKLLIRKTGEKLSIASNDPGVLQAIYIKMCREILMALNTFRIDDALNIAYNQIFDSINRYTELTQPKRVQQLVFN